jgi:hypothetical protein
MASVGRARNDAGLDGRADQVARRLATEHSPNGREANNAGVCTEKSDLETAHGQTIDIQ